MISENISFILNNHFIVRHCMAREGFDTPTDFRCRQGLRKWSRFFYLEKGEIDFISHTDKCITVKSGDILFLPYDIEYTSSWVDSTNGHYFSVEFILEYPGGGNLNLFEDITYLFNDTGYFKNIFSDMLQTVSSGALGFYLKCQEQLMHLLYLIAMRVKGSDSRYSDIRPALSAIEGNFCGEIDINELAEMCYLSPATFRRRFLEYAAMSPIKYRNMLRLNKARELISTGLYSVKQSAEIVGIHDICYFSKLYKRQFGVSPSCDLPSV